jgi:hypothetical protein
MTLEICGTLTDKMPLVAHGTASWSAGDLAHLSACADCAAEWELVQSTARLGERAAGRLDTARLATAVLDEVRTRKQRDRWGRGGWIAGLAAAAAVVLAVSLQGPPVRPPVALAVDSGAEQAVTVGMHLPLAELESLDQNQLESVLDALEAPVGEVNPGPAPSFGDLNDSQLESVLRSLEG